MIAWFPVEPCAGAWIFIPPPTVACSCSHAPRLVCSPPLIPETCARYFNTGTDACDSGIPLRPNPMLNVLATSRLARDIQLQPSFCSGSPALSISHSLTHSLTICLSLSLSLPSSLPLQVTALLQQVDNNINRATDSAARLITDAREFAGHAKKAQASIEVPKYSQQSCKHWITDTHKTNECKRTYMHECIDSYEEQQGL